MSDEPVEPIQEYSEDDIQKAFDEMDLTLEEQQRKHISFAKNIGHTRDVFSNIRPQVLKILEKSSTTPDIYPMVSDGMKFLFDYREELKCVDGMLIPVEREMNSLHSSTGSFAGTVSAFTRVANIYPYDPIKPLPEISKRGGDEKYRQFFGKLDPALLNSYDQVWQTYYGTQADNERGSLFMIRQVYDHFFDLLGPDEKVRASTHWSRKTGEKPNQVYRSEKYAYVAASFVRDEKRAATLISSLKTVLHLYKEANDAHIRGELDNIKAQMTIKAMDDVLKDWIDEISDANLQ